MKDVKELYFEIAINFLEILIALLEFLTSVN